MFLFYGLFFSFMLFLTTEEMFGTFSLNVSSKIVSRRVILSGGVGDTATQFFLMEFLKFLLKETQKKKTLYLP
jgi:hypothetical protein